MMIKTISTTLFFACLLNWGVTIAQSFPEPLSPRTASYDMNVVLDVDNKQVHAEQSLFFTNPSSDTIWSMQFHMYYNAWKNNKTDFFTESSRIPRTKPKDEIERCEWSWIEVVEVKDSLGNDLTNNMAFIQPDDDNIYDQTVLEIKLKEPVLPFQTYRLDMKWESQIPHLLVRTGYSKDFYFMVQWYPKLGVYEPAGARFAEKGQWNCHQYHPSTEYFGEFGLYNVTMTVPSDHVVGASGYLAKKEEKGTMTSYTYIAEDVIDFAWTSHPGFMEIVDQWEDVEIRLLIRPEHSCTTDRFMKAAKSTLSYYKDYIGVYPYPVLTIVSPPFFGLNSGAMEYPTLITVPTMCDFPEGIKTTETLTIHELTHQFFMQILATNEQEEPWLDEGFTSYFEAKILDDAFPEGIVSMPYLKMNVGSQELRRGRFFNADNIKVNPISDFGWHFKHGNSYSQIVYGKTAVALRTLEGLVGEEVMKNIMHTYFEKWKFKHPSGRDFIAIVDEIVTKEFDNIYAQNIKDFFHQAIYGTEECDYSVYSITNFIKQKAIGFLKNTEDCINDTDTGRNVYNSKAVFFREGELIVPQEILVVFDNGDEILEKWDGQARSFELEYTGGRKIISVHIDPDLKVAIDRNLINNSLTKKQESPGIIRYFISFLTWLQSIMITMAALV